MAGRAGTPRFGIYKSDVSGQVDDNGQNVVKEQSDDNFFTEQHFLYNPSQRSRDMGDSRGEDPQRGYNSDTRIYAAQCNHDGFQGGDAHIVVLDERKVLEDTMYSVPVVYSDDWFNNSGSDERSA